MIAVLRCASGKIHGSVEIHPINGPVADSQGVQFTVNIEGLSPGLHGFHIHKSGNDLTGPSTLCDHYNPKGGQHSHLNDPAGHYGDLGNLYFSKDKVCHQIIISTLLTPEEILGRSMVVHEDPDDLGLGNYKDSKTTGHSGKRILWGVIGRNEPC